MKKRILHLMLITMFLFSCAEGAPSVLGSFISLNGDSTGVTSAKTPDSSALSVGRISRPGGGTASDDPSTPTPSSPVAPSVSPSTTSNTSNNPSVDSYYSSITNQTGQDLKIALYNIIKNHRYDKYDDDVLTAYENTDKRDDGSVWDIYSDVPGGTPPYKYYFVKEDQCGNYKNEGDCYNREHSVPKSWFSSGQPMVSDLHHLYPTDGKVNGMRDNYVYSEVCSPTYTSLNGSKRGSSCFPGYTGSAFEPIDEYKGDLARTYFFMATRYQDKVKSWSGGMFGNTTTGFSAWALSLLLKWHHNDPVSAKEIYRNNGVYFVQNNRNPFIDRPEYVDLIFN